MSATLNRSIQSQMRVQLGKHWPMIFLKCYALMVIVEAIPVAAGTSAPLQTRIHCGKLWNPVIKVESLYLAFPHEYVGLGIWREGFASNIQIGCNDELKSVSL